MPTLAHPGAPLRCAAPPTCPLQPASLQDRQQNDTAVPRDVLAHSSLPATGPPAGGATAPAQQPSGLACPGELCLGLDWLHDALAGDLEGGVAAAGCSRAPPPQLMRANQPQLPRAAAAAASAAASVQLGLLQAPRGEQFAGQCAQIAPSFWFQPPAPPPVPQCPAQSALLSSLEAAAARSPEPLLFGWLQPGSAAKYGCQAVPAATAAAGGDPRWLLTCAAARPQLAASLPAAAGSLSGMAAAAGGIAEACGLSLQQKQLLAEAPRHGFSASLLPSLCSQPVPAASCLTHYLDSLCMQHFACLLHSLPRHQWPHLLQLATRDICVLPV